MHASPNAERAKTSFQANPGSNGFLGGMKRQFMELVSPQGHPRMVSDVRARWEQLSGCTTTQLRESANATRARVRHEGVDDTTACVDAMALMAEALRLSCGVSLYDVQIHAGDVLRRGAIAEMQTGEGKTYSCAAPAFLHSLTGRGVHVATTNAYLAERDQSILRPAFDLLGVSVGLLPEQGAVPEKRRAYQADVTFATGHEFGFDYLRDQLTLRGIEERPLATKLLARLEGADAGAMLQRGHYYSIVDEADNVLLDDAASPLVLSEGSQDEAPDANVYLAARDAVKELEHGRDYHLQSSHGVRFTPDGRRRIQSLGADVPVLSLRRTWAEYVSVSIRASRLARDVDYIVDDEDQVQIVDSSTGRIFKDRTWRDGLHQAVEAREGLRITDESGTLAQITRQRFSRLYDRLAGTTGTATGCEREFREVYRLDVIPIPLRTPSQRILWPTRVFATKTSKWHAIASSVREVRSTGRPVLIGTRTIEDSECLADLFSELKIEFQLLNGVQDADEAAVIALAGRPYAVTIATSLAGRGTDIKLDPSVKAAGGLHVIIAESNDSTRVDRQLIGRSGRQGDPGSAQSFLSAQDDLIRNHGCWLADSILRHCDEHGECKVNLETQIRRIQRSTERLAFSARYAMFQRDIASVSS